MIKIYLFCLNLILYIYGIKKYFIFLKIIIIKIEFYYMKNISLWKNKWYLDIFFFFNFVKIGKKLVIMIVGKKYVNFVKFVLIE